MNNLIGILVRLLVEEITLNFATSHSFLLGWVVELHVYVMCLHWLTCIYLHSYIG